MKEIFNRSGQSKDAICRKIGGDRNAIYREIDRLIGEGIVGYEDGGLFLISGDVWDGPLKELEGTISMDNEIIFETLLPRIKESLQKSKNPIFYHEPVIIQGQKFEGNLHRINDDAKSDLLIISWNIDRLIRSSFSLFSVVIMHAPPEKYKTKIDKAQKNALKIITKIKKELRTLTPKEFVEVFDEWWFQVTAGLKLN